ELTEYCPSTQCPAGFTTCTLSKFLCDVDLKSDTNNCGACGAACPGVGTQEYFTCVDGHCVLECSPWTADCDGLVDNGCEINLRDDSDNCSACGIRCPEDQPCHQQASATPQCGCPDGYGYCKATVGGSCYQMDRDDAHCGGCDTVCNRTGDPGAPPA